MKPMLAIGIPLAGLSLLGAVCLRSSGPGDPGRADPQPLDIATRSLCTQGVVPRLPGTEPGATAARHAVHGLGDLLPRLAAASRHDASQPVLDLAWRMVQGMRADRAHVAAVTQVIEGSSERQEIAVLVQVLEQYAQGVGPGERAALERWALERVRVETSDVRRNAALHYLLMAGPPSRETLWALASFANAHSSASARAVALWIWAAHAVADPGREAVLLSALESDSDPLVRRTAAEGLATLCSGPIPRQTQARALDLLRREPTGLVRESLLRSVAERGVEDTDTALVDLVLLARRDPEPSLRVAYLTTLHRLGGEPSLSILEACLRDPVLADASRALLAGLRRESNG